MSAPRWGQWELDQLTNALVINDGKPNEYYIALSRCHSGHATEQIIDHISHKRWAGPGVISNLRRALAELTHQEAHSA